MGVNTAPMQSSNVTAGLTYLGAPSNLQFTVPAHSIPAPNGNTSTFNFTIPTPKALCLSATAIQVQGDSFLTYSTAAYNGAYFSLSGTSLLIKNTGAYVMFPLVERTITGINLKVTFYNNLAAATVNIPQITLNVNSRFFDYPW